MLAYFPSFQALVGKHLEVALRTLVHNDNSLILLGAFIGQLMVEPIHNLPLIANKLKPLNFL